MGSLLDPKRKKTDLSMHSERQKENVERKFLCTTLVQGGIKLIRLVYIERGEIQKGAQVTVLNDFTKFILPLSYIEALRSSRYDSPINRKL